MCYGALYGIISKMETLGENIELPYCSNDKYTLHTQDW